MDPEPPSLPQLVLDSSGSTTRDQRLDLRVSDRFRTLHDEKLGTNLQPISSKLRREEACQTTGLVLRDRLDSFEKNAQLLDRRELIERGRGIIAVEEHAGCHVDARCRRPGPAPTGCWTDPPHGSSATGCSMWSIFRRSVPEWIYLRGPATRSPGARGPEKHELACPTRETFTHLSIAGRREIWWRVVTSRHVADIELATDPNNHMITVGLQRTSIRRDVPPAFGRQSMTERHVRPARCTERHDNSVTPLTTIAPYFPT